MSNVNSDLGPVKSTNPLSRPPLVEVYPDGSTSLCGQRFHSCIALMYFGLGFVVATACASWFPVAAEVRNAAALLTFFGGWAWILVPWYRGSRSTESA